MGKMSFWKMETSANRPEREKSLYSTLKKNTQWNKFNPFKMLLTIGIIEK